MKTRLLSTAAMSVFAAVVACSTSVSAEQDNLLLEFPHRHEVKTATPIKHLVVLFNENVSFDHYFATYPNAANPPGEIAFKAKKNTPKVNNLTNANLLVNNPNANAANGTGATNPFRLDRTQADTQSQNHGYKAEQQAYDNGLADLFPKFTGRGTAGGVGAFGTTGQVMGYFDGNTVAAFWNYAQNFAMSDNAYTDSYGPSTPGAINVISGQTAGALPSNTASPSGLVADGKGGFTVIGDADPTGDVCSKGNTFSMGGKNIGNLLNEADITWGSFMGGFDLTLKNSNGTTGCARSTLSPVTSRTVTDYIPHHAWFPYYASTSNPTHARPSSTQAIGQTLATDGKTVDPANHNYDLRDFFAAVKAGSFPAVSYIKMPAFQDGHPGNSNPLDEQAGMVDLINFLQQQKEWKETAVIVTYDDSDGWYDHAYAAPTTASYDPTNDAVNGVALCGTGPTTQPAALGLNGVPVNGRCGPGTRTPFVVISPWVKKNFVGHTRVSQASVMRFIEDNWLKGKRLGQGSNDASAGSIMEMFNFETVLGIDFDFNPAQKLFLDPTAGTPVASVPVTH